MQVIDVPVKIADPDKPLGTHVFTATGFKDGETAMRWTRRHHQARRPPARSPRRASGAGTRTKSTWRLQARMRMPRRALERIDIPEETSEQLAELMKPGSSFIISDYGLSRETSNRTEFVIEPWRARRHEENRDYSYE